MVDLLVVLMALGGVFLFVRSVWLLLKALRAKQRPGNHVAGMIGGFLIFLLAGGQAALQNSGSTASARGEKPPVKAPATEPTPAPPSASEPTDAQNLASIAGRDMNDPWIAEKTARLDELCPDETPSTADLVVNLQKLVKDQSGRELTIENVLEEFITAQEGGAALNMSCVETGGMLATLMIQGE